MHVARMRLGESACRIDSGHATPARFVKTNFAMRVFRFVFLTVAIVLLGACAGAPGEMIVDTDQGRTVYSKYFDGAEWLIPDELGVTVVSITIHHYPARCSATSRARTGMALAR